MDRSTTPPPEAAIHEINPDKLPTYIGAAEQAIVTRKSLGAHSLSNTSTAQASSETVIGILATIAKQERVRLAERTRAGLERVRREGKRLGRPAAKADAAMIRQILSRARHGLRLRGVLGCRVGQWRRFGMFGALFD